MTQIQADLQRIRARYPYLSDVSAFPAYRLTEVMITLRPATPWAETWARGLLTTGDRAVDARLRELRATSIETGYRPKDLSVTQLSFKLILGQPMNVWALVTRLAATSGYFAAVTPILDPVFINLSTLPDAQLQSAGAFGQVLRLLHGQRRPTAAFEALLADVIGQLERLPAGERSRWRELLTYIHALVYHGRAPHEVATLTGLGMAR